MECPQQPPQAPARGRAWPGLLAWLLFCALALAGCGRPNQENIRLRKFNQSLENRIEDLEKQLAADRATIAGLKDRIGTVPTLPESRLEEMFTVHGIELGRLSGGTDIDPQRPGDEGIKVYLRPVDASGEALKATGWVTVELFDLNLPSDNRIGRWEFSPEQLKSMWRSFAVLEDFVIVMPWQKVPQSRSLLVNVIFRDALTQRLFRAQKGITVDWPPTTQAAERP